MFLYITILKNGGVFISKRFFSCTQQHFLMWKKKKNVLQIPKETSFMYHYEERVLPSSFNKAGYCPSINLVVYLSALESEKKQKE